MELQTATKHILIDVLNTTRLSLGGTEERELIIMPEERSARAIAVWAAVELSRTGRGKSPSSQREYVRGIGGRTSSEGGVPQNKNKDFHEKQPFRKRTELARKWAERRFSSVASNTGGKVVEKNPGKAAGA